MTKSTSNNSNVLANGTVVVHNYTEFTHGVIVGHIEGDLYKVYFPTDMAPNVPKYQENTSAAMINRTRTITLGKGFFVSKHKSLDKVRALRRKYRQSGSDLENK